MKTICNYRIGQEVPDDAEYLWSCSDALGFVWHYFLVNKELKESKNGRNKK